jgi:hypothetical protein
MYDAQSSVQTSVVRGLAQGLHDTARRTVSTDPQDLFVNFVDRDSAGGTGAESAGGEAADAGTRVKLVPYRGPGGGHHVGSQEAFRGCRWL